MLEKLDIEWKDLSVIRNLYWDQTAFETIEGEQSDFKSIKRGVRQGCVMSPDPSPQQGDLRLSGPPSGQGAGSGARTRDRRVPADLRADSQATVLPTPRYLKKKSGRKTYDQDTTSCVKKVIVGGIYPIAF
ncbi:endonuclease-reverse transcriptase [Plakobranchus ocellatus]|uniref:Endonuclease-reverse transcriptase n=1 Tax=Plakobranchus ocellatus TaxID=259542 RepID=A0AAV3YXG5_9GAST|nr:endonuclease-reverse transcriptase [Plakobranchus ocellatus]